MPSQPLTPSQVADRLILTEHGPLVGPRPEVPGVDEAVVRRVVETFYGRIQEDGRLGPIFIAYVQDWSRHLDRMTAFWVQMVLRRPGYSGRPVQAHQGLPGMDEAHFERWLTLFQQTVEELVSEPAGRDAFLAPARRMADRIRTVSGKP
ncbi:MAG: group III truncated hemoglobin [Fimbriimonadaceae bacterium]|nr:group III truncated hemoglobin [Fimbriimonadaceae bacterium]